jgi:hypothetical protein
MSPSGVLRDSVATRFRFVMMGASSGVCRASINKVINDDEGDDKYEAVEVWLIVLLACHFLKGRRSDVS